MSMFELRIQPDGAEPFDVSAGMRDVRLWEKTHRGRSMGQLQSADGVSATVLFEVAYTACKRQGAIPAGLTEDEFCERYEIDFETPEEKAARVRAEQLKTRIEAGEQVELDEDEPTGGVPTELDPTQSAV